MKESSRDVAKRFLATSRQFFKASEHVFAAKEPSNRPLYFLYFHALELAFKGYFINKGVKTRSHDLHSIYQQCVDEGFVIGPDDRFDTGNVVALLTGANEAQGLRYVTKVGGVGFPELPWTRDVVMKVIYAVEDYIGVPHNAPPGPAVAFNFTFGKPTRKKGDQ